MIYCFCGGRKEIVYIYDPKFVTGFPKEFEIKFNRNLIEDVLDQCIKVKNALEKQRPPKRPMWAEQTCKACKECPYRNECWHYDRDSGFDSSDLSKAISSESGVGEEGTQPPRKTKVRFTETPFESD